MCNPRTLAGNRIRELRKGQSMTQEDLAARAGLYSTYIGGVVRGGRNISLDSIGKIANGLRVGPVGLFKFAQKRSCAAVEKDLKQKLGRHDPEVVLQILDLLDASSE